MNPYAAPFRPLAGPQDYDGQPPPQTANDAPPQPYLPAPHHPAGAQHTYLDYAAQAYYHQWAQYYAYLGYPPQPLPYYGAPSAPMQQPHPAYSHQHTHTHTHSQASLAQHTTNADSLQDTAPHVQTVHGHGPPKQKNSQIKGNQDELPGEPRTMTAKERRKDAKIHLPAPPPTPLYLSQAAQEPSTRDAPGQILVILDLNGTLIYRPNRNAKNMIARPFLKPFLRYLFANFNVMVWSSARPQNVDSLVGQCLDKDLRSKLVAEWARDSFSLSPEHYNLNVQVYKNLDLVWNSDIQQKHPHYAAGERFGQHNTVLIDDSSLKANAQPHNLLEVTEFKASPTDAKEDVLREVAGYLEVLRTQADVSKFIHKDPFRFDGRWQYDWPVETPNNVQSGKLESNVSLDTTSSSLESKLP